MRVSPCLGKLSSPACLLVGANRTPALAPFGQGVMNSEGEYATRLLKLWPKVSYLSLLATNAQTAACCAAPASYAAVANTGSEGQLRQPVHASPRGKTWRRGEHDLLGLRSGGV